MLEPIPELAPVVKEIFERYVSGESALSICQDINLRGYRTIKGNMFNKNSLPRLLENEKYLGIYRYEYEIEEHGEIVQKEHITNFTPTITNELYEAANMKKADNKRNPHKAENPVDFLLTGKLKCGKDNANMVGDSGTGKQGNVYHYYSCMNKKLKKSCKKKSVSKETLEALVVRDAKETILQDPIIEIIVEQVMKLQDKEADKSVLSGLKSQFNETQTALNNILKAIENGIFNDTTKSRMLELEKRKEQLDNEIYVETRRLETPKIKKEQLIYWLEKFKDGTVEDFEYQRKIIDTFVREVKVYDNKVIISYNYSGENSQNSIKIDDTEVFGFNPNIGA